MRQVQFAVLLAASVLALGLQAQSLQRPGELVPPTGLLMGVIVDPLDGQPVPNAQVTLGGASATVTTTEVLADVDGRFVFMDLPKGSYTITATKPGYADGAYGRRRAMGQFQALALADAERISDLKIPIWKYAVVTGRILDETGEPVVGVGVSVFQRTVVAGKAKLTPGVIARTDDRGVYRIASLTPGEYIVGFASTQATAPDSVVDLYAQRFVAARTQQATDFMRDASFGGMTTTLNLLDRYSDARIGTLAFLSASGGMRAGVGPMPGADGRVYVYPTQYYPAGSTTADASVIALRSGEERTGVDLRLKLVGTSRVSGIVTGPDGPLMVALSLVTDTDDFSTQIGYEAATSISNAAGRFTFLGVPPGRYRLIAVWVKVPPNPGASRGTPPPAPRQGGAPAPTLPALGGVTLWSAQAVTVGSTDIADLAVTVNPGFRVSGRAEFVGRADQPSPDQVRRMTTTLDPSDARPLVSAIIGRGQFDQTGQLSTYQVPPGRYYLRLNNVPAGWMLKSATVGGRDISNLPVLLDHDVSGVVVTFTDRPSSLSGTVTSADGSADASATVLLFPADAGAWTEYGEFPRRLRAIRVDRFGRYQTTALPSGDYRAVAVADESSANWQDPAVLQGLARISTAITIKDGEPQSLSLTTKAVKR